MERQDDGVEKEDVRMEWVYIYTVSGGRRVSDGMGGYYCQANNLMHLLMSTKILFDKNTSKYPHRSSYPR